MSHYELEDIRPNPNPKLVALIDYAIEQVSSRLQQKDKYADWLSWGLSWTSGRHSPQDCVDVAHNCFEHKDDPIWHCLGQLAWAAKEACYSNSKSGWLVVRYIADAMIAFGVSEMGGDGSDFHTLLSQFGPICPENSLMISM